MKKLVFASALFFVHALFAQPISATCMKACAGERETAFCLSLPQDEKLAKNFKDIYMQLKNEQITRIPKSHLMTLFNINDDPCLRSDTTRQNNVWTNSGLGCTLNAEVALLKSSKKISLEIHIPPELKFSVTSMNGWTQIKPQKNSSILQIGDQYLHSDWGGVIESIFASPNSAMFQMPRGCLKINL